MSAGDLLRRWSLRALLAEGLREVGNALVADEDQRDDREGGGIPHRVLCAEKHAPVGPPAERALEPGRVRRGFGDDLGLLVLVGLELGLFVLKGVDVGVARMLIASCFHR
jgi:hypothetical protein